MKIFFKSSQRFQVVSKLLFPFAVFILLRCQAGVRKAVVESQCSSSPSCVLNWRRQEDATAHSKASPHGHVCPMDSASSCLLPVPSYWVQHPVAVIAGNPRVPKAENGARFPFWLLQVLPLGCHYVHSLAEGIR